MPDDKYAILFETSIRWIQIKQEGKNLEEYFVKNNYHSIGIYGMSYLGERLFEELRNSSVKVAWGIDQEAHLIYIPGLKLYTLEEEKEKVDAVVVTPITYFDEIMQNMKNNIGNETAIISLEDILYEV